MDVVLLWNTFQKLRHCIESIHLDTLHANDSNDNENVRTLLLEYLYIDKYSVLISVNTVLCVMHMHTQKLNCY
jgi:hypothetical protein